MTQTRDYMRLAPWEALIQMVNDEYALDLHPATTTLVDVEGLADNNVEVTLAANRSRATRNLLPPMEQHTFVYERMDLSRFFRVTTPIPIAGLSLPTTTLDVVRELHDRTGVVFDRDDFIHEEILMLEATQVYTLHAHPRSLRWVGELPVTLTDVQAA